MRVAAIITEYSDRSHAHVILENFLEPYLFNGKLTSPGMDVVTQSGLIGKVTKVEDRIVTLQIDVQKDVRVRVSRSAITAEFSATEKAAA